jgi:hypothetical protein
VFEDVAAQARRLLVGPPRPCALSVVTPTGRPGLATSWFAFEDGVVYFHSRASALVAAAAAGAEAAFCCDEWAPPTISRVKLTGRLERSDARHRVRGLYARYLGDPSGWHPSWHQQVEAPECAVLRLVPTRGSAVTFGPMHADEDLSASLDLQGILQALEDDRNDEVGRSR